MNKHYAALAEKIIAQIEQGAKGEAYEMPWNRHGFRVPINALTRKPYRGVNVLALAEFGHEFCTFKQALELGHPVRKGEKAIAHVFKYGVWEKNRDTDEAESIPYLQSYAVFSVDQLTDYPKLVETAESKVRALALADRVLSAQGVTVTHGGNRACYIPSTDQIRVPPQSAFIDTAARNATEGYYGTLAHEHVHATGHASRLNRVFGKRFGDEKYAAEELVAEMGAAFLCGALGISPEVRPDHAQYVASWLRALKNDARNLWTAASKASEAADYIATKADAVQKEQTQEAIAA